MVVNGMGSVDAEAEAEAESESESDADVDVEADADAILASDISRKGGGWVERGVRITKSCLDGMAYWGVFIRS